MSLSCGCNDDYDWYYEEGKEKPAPKDCKCYGCLGEIKKDDEVFQFDCYEIDENGDQDYSDQKPFFLCEKCTGLYWSLKELGFCLTADDGFINDAMNDYREIYGKA